jgi:hypothetical protein
MITPLMNATERKCFFGGFTDYHALRQTRYEVSVSFAKNNINYSRSFAFICGK